MPLSNVMWTTANNATRQMLAVCVKKVSSSTNWDYVPRAPMNAQWITVYTVMVLMNVEDVTMAITIKMVTVSLTSPSMDYARSSSITRCASCAEKDGSLMWATGVCRSPPSPVTLTIVSPATKPITAQNV